MYNNLIREATNEEMAIYEKVNNIVLNMSDEESDRLIEAVGDRVFDWTHSKAIYNRVYRLGKKYGLTVDELETWYCID